MLALISVLAVLSGATYGVPLELTSTRIHGGVDAPQGFAPHMAALLSGDRWVFVICGGSIATKKHILTAAHCVTPFVKKDKLAPTFHGRVGSNIWHTGGVKVHFQNYFIHPKWDETNIKNDVAVLSLTDRLEVNDEVAVICLNFEWVGGDEKSYVTGWGTTWPKFTEDTVHLAPTPDQLQLLHTKTLTTEQCVEGIQASKEWAAISPAHDPRVEMCTFHSKGYGMCHGDSGSALVSEKTGCQSGVVSWGMPCAVGAPDFFVRLRGAEDFLRPILETCSCFDS